MSIHRVKRHVGDKEIIIETGKMAKQASGSVTVQVGGTMVFVAATSAPLENSSTDFFPLTVDYREKTYAAGKFPGGFFKREGRPTTKEILTMRLMDRPIRPLFPKGFKADVSIQSMVLSADLEACDPDILAINGASAALAISDVPFDGPLGAVRVARIDGKFVINPARSELENSTIDLVVAGTREAVCMVESSAKEVSEDEIIEAIEFGHERVKELIALQDELVALAGKEKQTFEVPDHSEPYKMLKALCGDLKKHLRTEGKMNRAKAVKELRDKVIADMLEQTGGEASPYTASLLKNLFEDIRSEEIRKMILEENIREDGRSLTTIRDITCEVGVLPMTHGSSLFTRGETQSLVVATLGSVSDEQMIDGLEETHYEKFMLHYNFPSYCVGETWPNRGPKRREIGHGQLALRALRAVLPPAEEFPYTIRIVSDVMESNGSSSMATVCGGTLSLLDAGVPIIRPVAGIAMGMISEGDKHCILTDILGDEDHCGDMDFKVAGTVNGINALQMDLKTKGIKTETMREGVKQAMIGIAHILEKMTAVMPTHREDVSEFAPRIALIKIEPDKIGKVIGPGGKTIRAISERTKAQIDIQDDGTVTISVVGGENMAAAKKAVLDLVEEAKVGTIYEGEVRSIKDFGAFVEILPGCDGLVHISELSDSYVKNIDDVVKVGDKMKVKVINIDDQGRIKLSRKQVEQ